MRLYRLIRSFTDRLKSLATVKANLIIINPLKTGRPLNGSLANNAEPDQTPQNAASDQDLHCLQIVQPFFFKNIYFIYHFRFVGIPVGIITLTLF